MRGPSNHQEINSSSCYMIIAAQRRRAAVCEESSSMCIKKKLCKDGPFPYQKKNEAQAVH